MSIFRKPGCGYETIANFAGKLIVLANFGLSFDGLKVWRVLFNKLQKDGDEIGLNILRRHRRFSRALHIKNLHSGAVKSAP